MSTGTENSYQSETKPAYKKHFLIGLSIYILGFIVLYSIGEAINSNGYLLRGFFAPFFILTGIVYIPYSLYKKR